VTQILTPRWIASAKLRGDLGRRLPSAARTAIARVFGAAVPERKPAQGVRSRALNFRVNGDLGSHDAIHLQYPLFLGHLGDQGAHRRARLQPLLSATSGWPTPSLRYYRQGHALFYSDDAQSETTYVSRNRQLSTFDSVGLGAKVAYTWRKVPGSYEVKLNGGYEYVRYKYSDFTDIRTGSPYSFNAGVLQLYVSATF